MGGGAACTGGDHGVGAFCASVTPGAPGLGMTTSSACDTKMFLPRPSYTVCSVEASKSSRSVGSRFSTRGFFPGFPPGRTVTRGAMGAAACALDAGVDESDSIGMISYAIARTAMTPSTAAHIVCFLLSNPSCTYDPAFKYV